MKKKNTKKKNIKKSEKNKKRSSFYLERSKLRIHKGSCGLLAKANKKDVFYIGQKPIEMGGILKDLIGAKMAEEVKKCPICYK